MPRDAELDAADGSGDASGSAPPSPDLDDAVGAAGEAHLVVGPTDTAIALGSGDVPVLGTPRVVALAEEATVAALAGRLAVGLTTVGARVEIDHLAPSRIGDEVVATARLAEAVSRRLRFEVEVIDTASGEVLARCVVNRVTVERAAFD